MISSITRRDFFGILPRCAFAIFLGTIYGKRAATAEVVKLKEELKGNDQGDNPKPISIEDAAHLKQVYNSTHNTSTAAAGMVTFTATSLVAARSNISHAAHYALIEKEVPVEQRPEEMKDMQEYILQSSRRIFMKSNIRGLTFATLLAPLIYFFSDPGEDVAHLIYGQKTKNDSFGVKAQRQALRDKANGRALISNALGIGGITAIVNSIVQGGRDFAKDFMVHFKFMGQQSFEQSGKLNFVVSNNIYAGEDLEVVLPDNLKVRGTMLGVEIARRQALTKSTLVYKDENPKRTGFYVRSISGTDEFNAVILRRCDNVTVTILQLGEKEVSDKPT